MVNVRDNIKEHWVVVWPWDVERDDEAVINYGIEVRVVDRVLEAKTDGEAGCESRLAEVWGRLGPSWRLME